ncbi:MAG: TetR/AcrR family transcriptional regulator, partial [Proteobacteria bacterium]
MARTSIKEKKKEMVLGLILDAAEEVWARSAGADLSMAMIAEEAGIAVGTLYNYFTDREALLETLVENRLVRFLESERDTITEISNQDFEVQLERFLKKIFTKERNESYRVLNMLGASHGEVKTAIRKKIGDLLFELYEPMFKKGVTEGFLKKPFKKETVVVFFGILRAVST